jgi:aspartyl-tRNA(Asn)/glutamyl-tRNA(Gln) amidotransferase subunit B
MDSLAWTGAAASMIMDFEPVIGLEVHAELETQSKMFCSCRVVDSTQAEPNITVCPVCAGMPGMLPVVNQKAVEFGLRVALALECEVNLTSIFARKNYFYPDLPKGYQISQYETPLARHGRLAILTSQGERLIRIRRVHLEEDTGKLTHVEQNGQSYSLVDLNRAGVPLLEIVTEPDLHSSEEVRAYAVALRSLLRYLGVNSGDMQKGVMRIEPNVSIRPAGSQQLGTRTEIKNLNSFRALERSVAYEIQRQSEVLRDGGRVSQETRGWDEGRGCTFTQRIKEGEDDYRYFPEPDLPPLVVEQERLDQLRAGLPELPADKLARFLAQYGLGPYDAGVLIVEPAVAEYFERAVQAAPGAPPKLLANWITGDLFGLLNQSGNTFEEVRVSPRNLAGLVEMVVKGEINQTTAKMVLAEMYTSGSTAGTIVAERGLRQVSDLNAIQGSVQRVLSENPDQVKTYLAGKETISRWLFGQVMRLTGGQANPQVVQQELERQLQALRAEKDSG